MKWPAYPKYKDSGIEWLGQVPEGWGVLPLRFICNVQTGDKDTVDAVENGTYPFFVRSQTVESIDSYSFDCEAILTAGDGVGVGKVFHYHVGKFDFHQRVYLFSKFRKITGRFFFYFLREEFCHVALDGNAKSTVDSLRRPLILAFPVAIPPLPEQHAIASFLDRETGRIDLLVSKKRTLIERLKEKRTALISRTVTRGLPPAAARAAGLPENPTLKPSGIEWLGEVPEGWNVLRLRRLITRLDQGWSPNANSYPAALGELGVLKLGAASKGKFYPEDNKALDEIPEGTAYITPVVGDVLISRANTPDLVGDACVVNSSHPNLIIPDLLYRLRFNAGVNADFVCWYFLSRSGRAQVDNDARGSSNSMIKLGQGHLRAWAIPLPPLPEQQAIAAFLDAETAKLDALVAKVEAAIERLLEYRTALITAAVTGKIDVRGAIQ